MKYTCKPSLFCIIAIDACKPYSLHSDKHCVLISTPFKRLFKFFTYGSQLIIKIQPVYVGIHLNAKGNRIGNGLRILNPFAHIG